MAAGLNAKQQRFVDLYLISLNASEAYKGAYGPKSDTVAAVNAARLLKNAKVALAVAEGQLERAGRTAIDQDYVVKNLAEVVERCMERAPVMERDRHDGRKWVQKTDEDDNNVWTFDARGAVAALTVLAKHTGGFSEKMEHKITAAAGVLAVPVPIASDQWAGLASTQQAQLLAQPAKALVS